MLGDGNLENECKNYESENIIFTGRVKNVNEYLLASDILYLHQRQKDYHVRY